LINIQIKLPDYCKTTNNPRFKVVEVSTPTQWLPRYTEIAQIIQALTECERQNRVNGQQQYSANEVQL